jgi:hypothetical protein
VNKDTGGPAFPVGTAYQGMTLRDYFAAKAMQSLIRILHPEDVSRNAYKIADAMLQARNQ